MESPDIIDSFQIEIVRKSPSKLKHFAIFHLITLGVIIISIFILYLTNEMFPAVYIGIWFISFPVIIHIISVRSYKANKRLTFKEKMIPAFTLPALIIFFILSIVFITDMLDGGKTEITFQGVGYGILCFLFEAAICLIFSAIIKSRISNYNLTDKQPQGIAPTDT